MKRTNIVALLACSALLPLGAAAHDGNGKDAGAEAKRPEPKMISSGPDLMLTRDDGVALATTRKQPCTVDVLEVFFHDKRFAFEGGLLEADALVERVRQRKTKKPVACVRVTGPYDRAAFDALGNALVDPVGVSLSWPRPNL